MRSVRFLSIHISVNLLWFSHVYFGVLLTNFSLATLFIDVYLAFFQFSLWQRTAKKQMLFIMVMTLMLMTVMIMEGSGQLGQIITINKEDKISILVNEAILSVGM